MNTLFSKAIFGMMTLAALSAVPACTFDPSQIDESDFGSQEDQDDEVTGQEAVGAAAQALISPPPVNTPVRIKIHPDKNLCFDLPGPVGKALPLIQKTCDQQPLGNSNNTQAWRFEKVDNSEQYRVKPHYPLNNNLCLAISGPSMDNGGAVVLLDCASMASRQFNYLEYSGFFLLQAGHSSRCLTVPGSSSDDFAAITQYGTSSTADCSGVYMNQRLMLITN